MHEMLIIVTDVCSVCQSVCLSRGLNWQRWMQCTPRAMCVGSFGAVFAKCFWPLVHISSSFQPSSLASGWLQAVFVHLNLLLFVCDSSLRFIFNQSARLFCVQQCYFWFFSFSLKEFVFSKQLVIMLYTSAINWLESLDCELSVVCQVVCKTLLIV